MHAVTQMQRKSQMHDIYFRKIALSRFLHYKLTKLLA